MIKNPLPMHPGKVLAEAYLSQHDLGTGEGLRLLFAHDKQDRERQARHLAVIRNCTGIRAGHIRGDVGQDAGGI